MQKENVVARVDAPSCELVRPRVICADDSPTQRALVQMVLGDRYDVVVVPDGASALKAILAAPPDAIISDLEMPGMGGSELLRAVKSREDSQRIPFILVTTHAGNAVRSLEAGADDYLAKPFGPEELRARVAAAIRSYRMYIALERQHRQLSATLEESRRLELELREAQKLEAVGRLASGIAHEINTPIQFVGDNLQFLRDAFQALTSTLAAYEEAIEALGAPAEARRRLAEVAAEADLVYVREQVPRTFTETLDGTRRVAAIVRALKEFAHPDQKEMVATDLNRALQATLQVARNEYKYVATVETDLGPIPLVECHAGDLNQVFLNIIVNAAHAIGDEMKRTARMGVIRIRTREVDDAVEVSISDTGGGIPEAIRHRIFEPFFTTKEVGRGTGQGLAIARNVVEQHGGTIRFETRAGEGTTFHVRLPVGAERRAA